MYISYEAAAAAGKEGASAWGTAVSRTVAFDCNAITPTNSQPRAPSARMHQGGSGGVAARSFKSGRKDAGVRVGLDLLLGGCGLLIESAMGSSNTDANTPSSGRHTHTYSLSSSLPSLTWEVYEGLNLEGSETSRILTGAVCNTWTINLPEGPGLITSTFDYVGKEFATPGAQAALPTFASGVEIESTDLTTDGFSWNGSEYPFQTGTITLDNKVARRNQHGSATTPKVYALTGGQREVTLRVTREYVDNTFKAAEEAGTSSDCVLTYTSTNSDEITFTLHNAQVEGYQPPDFSGIGPLVESFTLRGHAEGDGTDLGFSVVIENAQTTAIEA